MADKVTSPVDMEIAVSEMRAKERGARADRICQLEAEVTALRAGAQAFAALNRVVDNCGGDGEPVGGVDLSIRWNDDLQRYEIGGSAGECTFGADAPTLEVAVVAASMADEGEHRSVSADGHLQCWECDGGGCAECDGLGLVSDLHGGWPKGGLKVPESTVSMLAATEERDEARRELCRALALAGPRVAAISPHEHAVGRWGQHVADKLFPQDEATQ